MNEQHVPADIRILNAIDQDIEDAKITLGLIEKLTEENSNTHSNIFNKDEIQTLIRNCIHAIILNLTKTIEYPQWETFNLESHIDAVCHDDDKDQLKIIVKGIRGDHIYGNIRKYRDKIIAHRGIDYKGQHAIKQVFEECKKYIINNKQHINMLLNKINDLQMKIKGSKNKKAGLPEYGADTFKIHVKLP